MPGIESFQRFADHQHVGFGESGLQDRGAKSVFTRSSGDRTAFRKATTEFHAALKARYGAPIADAAFRPLAGGMRARLGSPLTGAQIKQVIGEAERMKSDLSAAAASGRASSVTTRANLVMARDYPQTLKPAFQGPGMKDLCKDLCKKAISEPGSGRGPALSVLKADMTKMKSELRNINDALSYAMHSGLELSSEAPEMYPKADLVRTFKAHSADILKLALGDKPLSFLKTPEGKQALSDATKVWLACKTSPDPAVSNPANIRKNAQLILEGWREKRDYEGAKPSAGEQLTFDTDAIRSSALDAHGIADEGIQAEADMLEALVDSPPERVGPEAGGRVAQQEEELEPGAGEVSPDPLPPQVEGQPRVPDRNMRAEGAVMDDEFEPGGMERPGAEVPPAPEGLPQIEGRGRVPDQSVRVEAPVVDEEPEPGAMERREGDLPFAPGGPSHMEGGVRMPQQSLRVEDAVVEDELEPGSMKRAGGGLSLPPLAPGGPSRMEDIGRASEENTTFEETSFEGGPASESFRMPSSTPPGGLSFRSTQDEPAPDLEDGLTAPEDTGLPSRTEDSVFPREGNLRAEGSTTDLPQEGGLPAFMRPPAEAPTFTMRPPHMEGSRPLPEQGLRPEGAPVDRGPGAGSGPLEFMGPPLEAPPEGLVFESPTDAPPSYESLSMRPEPPLDRGPGVGGRPLEFFGPPREMPPGGLRPSSSEDAPPPAYEPPSMRPQGTVLPGRVEGSRRPPPASERGMRTEGRPPAPAPAQDGIIDIPDFQPPVATPRIRTPLEVDLSRGKMDIMNSRLRGLPAMDTADKSKLGNVALGIGGLQKRLENLEPGNTVLLANTLSDISKLEARLGEVQTQGPGHLDFGLVKDMKDMLSRMKQDALRLGGVGDRSAPGGLAPLVPRAWPRDVQRLVIVHQTVVRERRTPSHSMEFNMTELNREIASLKRQLSPRPTPPGVITIQQPVLRSDSRQALDAAL
ncbi:MAG TPA: hypothetical protein VK970_26355, partial [Candidatus Methylacidiphilales bacterium]|nr:hypothetical protein [Candidatus Methylacidiphilales bacterium]